MHRLYTFFIYLFTPFIVLRLYLRGKKNPAYRERISERFALNKNIPQNIDVWLHGVSLGEIVAATPLIEELLKANKTLLITTMTPAGSKQVISKFSDKVYHQYVPYDLPICLNRFFKRINAKVGIIMETEIWPNMIHCASKHGIKLGLVNARISDKAYTQYAKTGKFFRATLNKFSFIAAQSEIDAKRYKGLGASCDIVSVVGNIKFDVKHPGSNLKDFTNLQNSWGKERPVFIAASTHDNEEMQLLRSLNKLQGLVPDIILLIAPRHIERSEKIYELSEKFGFNTALRSKVASITQRTDVVVLDTIGELLGFYKLSDYAFVGGSLVPIGGHNVLEPILMDVPVFCGPFMQNSKAICDQLLAANAMVIAKDVDDLLTQIIEMSTDENVRAKQVANAKAVLESNRGVLDKYLGKILSLSEKQL